MDVALAELVWSLSPAWHENAVCRGHQDLFYVEQDRGPAVVAHAHAICRVMCSSCPVFADCRADVDRSRDAHGFRAGESAMERRRRWKTEGLSLVQRERAERRRRVVELRAQGLTHPEIARRLNVSTSTVVNDLNAVA